MRHGEIVSIYATELKIGKTSVTRMRNGFFSNILVIFTAL